jgi:hypothetical protein
MPLPMPLDPPVTTTDRPLRDWVKTQRSKCDGDSEKAPCPRLNSNAT